MAEAHRHDADITTHIGMVRFLPCAELLLYTCKNQRKLALTRVHSAFVHYFFTRVACTLHVQLRSDNLDEVIAAAEVAFVSVF